MRINIVHGNLIEAEVDAIVNSADSSLLGGCGVDEAIHQAADPGLLEECRRLGSCKTGQARMTGAHSLPCKCIIHTVVPTWRGGFLGERRKLASCYRTSLELALEHGCESIAFPLLGTGSRGYPKDKALQIALKTIKAFLNRHDDCEMLVTLMIRNRADYQIDPKLAQKITAYLDRRHPTGQWTASRTREEPEVRPHRPQTGPQQNAARSADQMKKAQQETAKPTPPEPSPQAGEGTCMFFQEPGVFPSPMQDSAMVFSQPALPALRLEDRLGHLGDGFSQTLMRLIKEKRVDHVQCYKKANIDRRLFSRIISNPNYKPSKPTALAFAVSLKLTLDETNALLKSAGLALSSAQKFDVIVEFFISQGCFDIFTINAALVDYDQPLLGGE